MFGDGTNITMNDTNTFCRQHCPGYLIDLSERLIKDCEFPDTLV